MQQKILPESQTPGVHSDVTPTLLGDLSAAPRLRPYSRLLRALARLCATRPRSILSIALLLALACGVFTLKTLRFSSSRTDMLNPAAPAQRKWRAVQAAFDVTADFIVLASGPADECETALDELSQRLSQEPQVFSKVFHRLDLPEFSHSTLYYLSEGDLRRLRDVLRVARPWLSALAGKQGLNGLIPSLTSNDPALTVRQMTPALPFINRLLRGLVENLESRATSPYLSPMGEFQPDASALRGRTLRPGQTRFYNTLPDGRTYMLLCSPADTSGTFSVDVKTVARLRQLVAQLSSHHPEVRLVVSGEPVLNTDEMAGAQRDATRSGMWSLLLVAGLLRIAFRNNWEPVFLLLSLGLALAWSCAFAALSVQTLNLLTINFATILVGLGLTFGIHILYRYREQRAAGASPEAALQATIEKAGRDDLVGAATTAIAFWALHFTAFRSAAELGLITGTGVLFCYTAMITVVPSLLAWRDQGPDAQLPTSRPNGLARADCAVRARPALVLGGTLALTLYSLTWLSRVGFDYNMLNLQPRNSEAVRVEHGLQRSGYSALNAVVIARDVPEAVRQSRALLQQPSVSQVDSVVSLLPTRVSAKQPVIREIIRLSRGLALPRPPRRMEASQMLSLLSQFQLLRRQAAPAVQLWQSTSSAAAARELNVLLARLDQNLDRANPGPVQESLRSFQAALANDLTTQLSRLRQQTDHAPDVLAHLPAALRVRSLAKDGRVALRVFARHDIWEREALERFVQSVERVNPSASGAPFLIYDYLEELRTAYSTSGRNALVVIAVLLLLHFRSLLLAALAITPKLLAVLWMIGAMGLCGAQFNPANFLALPLTLGVGLIFGVHVLQRLLESESESLFENSVGPAVLLSGLTSIVGFATLMLAGHRGVASFGLVMTLGMGANLVSSLVTLPALVSLLRRLGWKPKGGSAGSA